MATSSADHGSVEAPTPSTQKTASHCIDTWQDILTSKRYLFVEE